MVGLAFIRALICSMYKIHSEGVLYWDPVYHRCSSSCNAYDDLENATECDMNVALVSDAGTS